MVARTVAETFFTQIVEGPAKLEELVQYMDQRKCTMVQEILQPKYQHVENLSHLEGPKLMLVVDLVFSKLLKFKRKYHSNRFICWTSYKMIADEDCKSLCLVPPDQAIDQARDLGILSVDYEEVNTEVTEDYMNKVYKIGCL